MGLQVWLPLTEDLHNQGLNQITVTNNGATINDNGKIGKCYSFDGSDDRIFSSAIDISSSSLSIAFWANISSSNGSSTAYLFGLSETSAPSFMLAIYNSSLRMYINGESRKSFSITSYLDAWHHYAMTFNGNIICLYIDGIQVTTQTYTATAFNTNYIYIGARKNGSTEGSARFYFEGLLNDCRLYDHALSPKEVEEIAKGLVLHYHLNGENTVIVPPEYQQLEYLESTSARTQWINTGIVPTDNFEYRFKYTLNACTGYQGPFGAYCGEDYKATRLIDVNGSTTTIYLHFRSKAGGGGKTVKIAQTDMTNNIIEGKISKNSYYLKNLTSNEEFFSATPFADTGEDNATTMKLFGSGRNPGSGAVTTSYTRIYYFDTYNNGVCIQKLVPVKRLSDNVLGLYDVITGIFLTNAGSGTFTAGPNITITGTVYDSSGYRNNGETVGELSTIAPSPKYDVATVFNGSSAIKACNGGMVKDAITVSCWVYMNNWSNFASSNRFISCGGWEWCFSANDTIRCYLKSVYQSSKVYSLAANSTKTYANLNNGWHHFLFTFDGLNLISYIDGQEDSYRNFGSNKMEVYYTSDDVIFIGAKTENNSTNPESNTYFTGRISDVRIYATALTAAQVAELYNLSMDIDASGNLIPREPVII